MRGPAAGAKRGLWALVVGGGTAGHAIPALEVALEVEARHGAGSVQLVGGRRGLEAKVWDTSGLQAAYLPGRGLPHRRGGTVAGCRRIAGSIAFAGGVVVSLASAARAVLGGLTLVIRRRPSVVVVFGGYTSAGPALAAVIKRVPLVVVNVDSVAGRANRVLARFARVSAVAWEETELPRKRITGVPVRTEVLQAGVIRAGSLPAAVARVDACRELGIPDGRLVVAVMGGSLGAKRVNELALEMAAAIGSRRDIAVYHIAGDRDVDWVRKEAERRNLGPSSAVTGVGSDGEAVAAAGSDDRLHYRIVGYEERMGAVYAAADMMICRAGAVTVAELAAARMPAVLIPLPGAPHDHQARNARQLVAQGGAVMLREEDLDVTQLVETVEALAGDPARLVEMSGALGALGFASATGAIADLAESVARGKRR